MEKMMVLRSLCRAASGFRSSRFAAITHNQLLCHHLASRSLFIFSLPSSATPPQSVPSAFRSSFAMGIGSARSFSQDIAHMPTINDPEIHMAFKELMAASWDELPDALIDDVKHALSKNTDDKAGKEILANVFRAAEAVEEFGGMIMNLKMELDDVVGAIGENVQPLTEEHASAIETVFQRYIAYLAEFGPDEVYLRKKVDTELGSKLIYLKMRCGGLDAKWGKVSVLATSGLGGSYVEHRA